MLAPNVTRQHLRTGLSSTLGLAWVAVAREIELDGIRGLGSEALKRETWLHLEVGPAGHVGGLG